MQGGIAVALESFIAPFSHRSRSAASTRPRRDGPIAHPRTTVPDVPARRFDIFCRVVDNYGDAGVCWRLARQLVSEHGAAVTLWIDALASLARIAPGLDAHVPDQRCAGVRVRTLVTSPLARFALADVVVEGFGCGLPDDYVAAMADASHAPR